MKQPIAQNISLAVTIAILAVISSCQNENHFLNDPKYREQVLKDFQEVEKQLANPNIFTIFNQNLSLQEKEALQFLYAYMPLSDIADYDGQFFLNQIRIAFKARESMPWGATIPEYVFRHFVLPPRVNNENMDSARIVFYKELASRVKNLSIEEAALEVNHWCHEKVIYQPTCERTIGPLSIIKSAYGRCGEESTFTVTALRSVGIPARQCYTPRWAHCDDNHAWVEVWINGTWKYLGACEPEPKLNIAWFNEPVLRAMLVHTKALGKYHGSELVDQQFDKYAYMNLIDNYAPNKKIHVKVTNTHKVAIPDATVEFQLYNYAEFYPLSIQKTDENGNCSFTTGLGDLLVWVNKNGNFNYQKITVENTDTLTISLDTVLKTTSIYTDHFIPPVKRKAKIALSDNEKNEHQSLLNYEDSIRTSFIETFIDKQEAYEFAKDLGLDEKLVWNALKKSRGNWQNISSYLTEGVKLDKPLCIAQLKTLSDKDLRDTESKLLISNLKHTLLLPRNESDQFIRYVLNPRIANEMLWEAKAFFKTFNAENAITHPKHLISWILNELTIADDWNYYKAPISGEGVYKTRICDIKSRNLFFVQGCRSMGIPSRLEPETKIPQYLENKLWVDADFKIHEKSNRMKGRLKLSLAPELKFDPLYRIHFSIAKLDKGRYNTLDYGWNKGFSTFENPIILDAGSYYLLSGNRQDDGSVFTQIRFFDIMESQTQSLLLDFHTPENQIQETTQIKSHFQLFDTHGNLQNISTNEQKVFIWLDTQGEPSKHVLNDFGLLHNEFDDSDVTFYFIIDEIALKQNRSDLKQYILPANSQLLVDKNHRELNRLLKELSLTVNHLPVVLMVKNNRLLYSNCGYTVGIPEQLLKKARLEN